MVHDVVSFVSVPQQKPSKRSEGLAQDYSKYMGISHQYTNKDTSSFQRQNAYPEAPRLHP